MPEVRVIDLGYRPFPWQEMVHALMKRFNVLIVHRRGGKTVLALRALIDAALRTVKSNARYSYIGPYKSQAKEIAWSYLKQFTKDIPGVKYSEHEGPFVTFPNGAKILIQGADDPDSLRGSYLDGVIMDEFEDIKPDVWTAIVIPMLSDRQGWAIIMGTVHGTGRLSSIYHKAKSDPEWFAGSFNVYDTKTLKQEEVDRAQRNMSERQFAQEYLNDMNVGAENSLLSLNQVMESANLRPEPAFYERDAKIVGVDVARGGNDVCAICIRQGRKMWPIMTFRSEDDMYTVGRITQIIHEHQPDGVCIDATGGFGSGICDRLKQMNYEVNGINFASSPIDERYNNKRTEMWLSLRDWVKEGGALPNDQMLFEELTCAEYNYRNARGKMQLESKDEIKLKIQRSPDRVDAAVLTFAMHFLKKNPYDIFLNIAHETNDERSFYNPLVKGD